MHSAWGMDCRNSKRGYTEIPSPQEKQQNHYCWTDSCVRDTQEGEDAQTIENLKDLQSSLFIEASLYKDSTAEKPIAQTAKVYDLPNDIDFNQVPSVIPDIHDGNIQNPTIAIQNVVPMGNQFAVHYILERETNTRTALVSLNKTIQAPLDAGLVITISAFLASSKPNATRK
jgi:hypothetical protein